MFTTQPPEDLEDLLALARDHGLELDGSSLRTEEMGLDFRVAFGRAHDGQRWVLRIPRRADVLSRADVEGRLLRLVAPQLDVAVPDWRINSPELIAYPLLPGLPGLSLETDGTVTWRIDISSRAYAESLGRMVAQLHGIDAVDAAATGIEVRSPAQVREAWMRDLDRVAAEFEIAPALWERWRAWVAEDSYWPQHSVLTHGEIYPAHTLVEGERISALLDWTTAAVGDPARDLLFHQASAPPEVFEHAVGAYADGGGTPWPRLAEHCAEMFSASPVAYGLFALETGEAEHRAAAAAGLNPAEEA
ncbi:MAG: phosphotransferase [Actinomycetales bacterium]|nr:phosphotransferase [Actinomycetales bacterium]